MITIKTTENLTGVSISGDYYDFTNLVEAFYAISIDEDDVKRRHYYDNSIRILGLCYEIRHAFMGDRDILLVENGMSKDIMEFQSQITPENNVYFECKYLFPEMFFIIIALNELIELYIGINSKPKNDYKGALNKAVIWDRNIIILRSLQSAFNQCVKDTLHASTYTRWLNIMNSYNYILTMNLHFLDHHNIEYLKLDKEQRKKKLSTIAKRIAEYQSDNLHYRYKTEAEEAAEYYGCSPSDLKHPKLNYPDEIEW